MMATLVAGLVAAAPAGAASIAVNAPCFLDSDMITVTGTGFTPGAGVSYAFDGVASTSGAADGSGNITQQIAAPVLPVDTTEHTYNLTGTDQANLGNVGSTQVTVTQLTATLNPQKARPNRRIKFNVHGMPPGVPLYLHYVFHKRSKADVALGTPKAPCGSLSVKRRFFPFSKPKTGTWTFQFDDKKSYSSATRPAIRGKILIYRTTTSSATASMLG